MQSLDSLYGVEAEPAYFLNALDVLVRLFPANSVTSSRVLALTE
jgi:hypothetical protein